jgi:NTF2 fold immunity protein of polymorphic toxin system component
MSSGELAMREDASPEAVVEAFIQAMNDWERRAWRVSRAARDSADPSSCWPEIRATMDAVFATYCTPHERPHGRQGSFQKPPQYDPRSERVVRAAIDQDRAYVETDRVSPLGGGAHRYTLHRRAHRWLIDNVKRQDGERWVPDTL